MTVGATSGTTPPTTPASTAPTTGLTGDFNTFLKLLTTQLKNQDPSSPMDTEQFTQQLVSFSGVEQQINTNSNLKTLISMQNANQLISLQPTVGKTIEYTGNTTTLPSGGSANYSYTLPSQAADTTLTVTDQNNTVLWTGSGETTAGPHVFSWNGLTNNGGQVPPGVYTLTATATAADKSKITVTQTAFGKVNSVQAQNGATVLDIGGYQVPISNLISVGSGA